MSHTVLPNNDKKAWFALAHWQSGRSRRAVEKSTVSWRPPKRRTELNRGKKKSTGRLSQTVSFPYHPTANMSVASTEQAVGGLSVSKTARSSMSAAMRSARSSKSSAMGTARNRSVAPGTARSAASGTLGTARSSSMD